MANTAAETFYCDLSMLLRDVSRGTAARHTDYVVAWWDRRQAVFVYLREDDPRLLEEELELSDVHWEQWAAELTAWLRAPQFERFAEIEGWIADPPPYDAGSAG